MGLRTIEAPGVEIKEIDKSGYTPAMTGTRCYVMGYATKGEPYAPMEFTSKAAWQSYYGDPDNEAERYFYNACSEVINQNGVLYCARLPYDNESYNKMVGFKYTVGSKTKKVPSAKDYLNKPEISSIVSHDKDFESDALSYIIDNNILREIDGVISNRMEVDDEIQKFYREALTLYSKVVNKKNDNILNERYSIRCYTLNEEETNEFTLTFNTENKAQDYIKEYKDGKSDVPYSVKYETNIKETGNGDWEAHIYKYDYTTQVIDENPLYLSNYIDVKDTLENINAQSLQYMFNIIGEIDNLLSIGIEVDEISPGKLCNAINYISKQCDISNKFLSPTYSSIRDVIEAFRTIFLKSIGDDKEINKVEALLLKKQLEEHELINVGNSETKKYIDVVAKNDGYSFEKFFKLTIRELQELLNVGAGYEGIYEESKDYALSTKETTITVNGKEIPSTGFLIKSHEQILDTTTGKEIHKIEYFKDFEDVLKYFIENGSIMVSHLYEKYGCDKSKVKKELKFFQIGEADSTIQDYIEIKHGLEPVIEDITKVQEYATGESKVPSQSFWVFDRTCARLNKITEDSRKGKQRELVGIFPVVTTAANALLAQKLMNVDDEDIVDYESVTGTLTKDWIDEAGNQKSGFSLKPEDLVKQFSNSTVDTEKYGIMETVSQEANNYFSTISMNTEATGFDSENLKKIGVVVFKAYIDSSEGGKVNFTPVESFCGSLDKDAKNPTTGASTFIDKIVNGLSQYIYFFSNCFANKNTKKMLNEEADIFIIEPGTTGMLGFYESETAETISLTKLYSGIDTCFELVKDVNERDIDIIPDAGLANIAYYLAAMKDKAGIPEPMHYDMEPTDENGNALIGFWTCKSASDLNAWKTVEFKLDNFCKNVRKDCMFIADGPRPMVLQGQKKIVRPSKPSNTIDANILPFVKYATGLNTNYGAGYLDWFQITDEFSGDEFWCPPSIKAMGVYINTDLNFNYWDAPAGLNRGVIQALDTAFSPTIKQAGSIYGKNWNYAINYPYDGIVLEGQKTFQVKPSAFDRVNVRRLFLRLERQVYKIARYFVYEGNTSFTRQRLVDAIEPLLYQAKVGGGLYDYKIKCDEQINDPTTIDRNELKCMIGLKPTKTAEFLMIDFVALSTGGSWSEAGF